MLQTETVPLGHPATPSYDYFKTFLYVSLLGCTFIPVDKKTLLTHLFVAFVATRIYLWFHPNVVHPHILSKKECALLDDTRQHRKYNEYEELVSMASRRPLILVEDSRLCFLEHRDEILSKNASLLPPQLERTTADYDYKPLLLDFIMPTFLSKGCHAIQLPVLEQISTDEEPSASNSHSSHTDKYDLPVGQDYLWMGKPQGATKYEDLCHSVVDPELNTGLGLTHRFFNVQDVSIIHRLGENPSVHGEGFHNPAFHVLSPGDGGSGDGSNEPGDGGDGPSSGAKSDDGSDGERFEDGGDDQLSTDLGTPGSTGTTNKTEQASGSSEFNPQKAAEGVNPGTSGSNNIAESTIQDRLSPFSAPSIEQAGWRRATWAKKGKGPEY